MDNYLHWSVPGDPHKELNLCLNNILTLLKPLEEDRLKRWDILNELATHLRSGESLKDVVVKPFGSFVSNLYTKGGDLDISVELSHTSPSSTSRNRKQRALRDIMKVLRRTGVARNIQYIPNARVPLLIFESNRQNISCDVSIDNHIGYMKSRILFLINEIDERFRDMILLIKEWAKLQNINDPKSGTLNSYSLCLLVIFHFQTCKPAILPPLKDIYPGNIVDITGSWFNLERQIEDVCVANIARFKISRQGNNDSLCQLLISFFDKFSRIELKASEYVISTYTGQWEMIATNPRWMEKLHRLYIEDPFEQPDNAARAVGWRELSMISNALRGAYQKLSSNHVLSDRDALLSTLVRPNFTSQFRVRTEGHHITAQKNQRNVPSQSNGHQLYPPSSNVTLQSQRATNVQGQQVWRPRYSNS